MLRCRNLILSVLMAAVLLGAPHRSAASQYSGNMFLNGEYKNSISAHPEAQGFSMNPASNIFLSHAIISRQASPFQGPTYLPPPEFLKCGSGQQCVRQNQCQGGYFTQLQPKILNCNPETDICCTYRAPPTTTTTTTTTTTPKPFVTCASDSDCVSAEYCRNGEIVAVDYIKKYSTSSCYAPEVCCRMPSTTLTSDGYILHLPEKLFPLPTNPTVLAQGTTQAAYRPAPTQPAPSTPAPYRPQPTQATPAPYRPQPTQPATYRPQPTTPSNEYLPPQTTTVRQTPRPQPTQPAYRPQPTQAPPAPYQPQPTQGPTYQPRPPVPTVEYLPPQTPARPQPTQPIYQPQPTQPAYRPQSVKPNNEYLPPQPTEGRPSPTRPQPTQPAYRPQPTQTPRPQPTQPAYRPQPTQPTYRPIPSQPQRPQPVQPSYRPSVNQYLPPDSVNEIDRQPEPSNVNPVQRGEDQLSPRIFPTPKTPPKSFGKCASALVCTAENYCNSIGVISETPVELTSQEAAFRVPLTDCLIADSGAAGKCCRDPNYVDPWPVNLAGVCASRNKNTKPTGIKDIDANFAEIPWQAMVLKESTKSLLCGGAIIGDEFVLTTASCVSGVSVPDVRVKAGEWELGSTTEPLPFQLASAKTIDLHPQYNPSTGANDMAIIRLQKRFEFATHIQPICITDEDPKPSEQCVTTGWGKQALQIHEEGAIMHVTNTSPLSRSDCGADGTSVCSSTKFDSCEFDAGSALACGTGSNVRLKGIFTTENACGENQAVRFSKPDIKWINTAFVDRNKPLLLKRV